MGKSASKALTSTSNKIIKTPDDRQITPEVMERIRALKDNNRTNFEILKQIKAEYPANTYSTIDINRYCIALDLEACGVIADAPLSEICKDHVGIAQAALKALIDNNGLQDIKQNNLEAFLKLSDNLRAWVLVQNQLSKTQAIQNQHNTQINIGVNGEAIDTIDKSRDAISRFLQSRAEDSGREG